MNLYGRADTLFLYITIIIISRYALLEVSILSCFFVALVAQIIMTFFSYPAFNLYQSHLHLNKSKAAADTTAR
jgi:uncharacterized membrane protein